jgi:hypothetical protein
MSDQDIEELMTSELLIEIDSELARVKTRRDRAAQELATHWTGIRPGDTIEYDVGKIRAKAIVLGIWARNHDRRLGYRVEIKHLRANGAQTANKRTISEAQHPTKLEP